MKKQEDFYNYSVGSLYFFIPQIYISRSMIHRPTDTAPRNNKKTAITQ